MIFLRDAEADRNLYWNTADPQWGKDHLDAEQKHGSELNSIAADPLFADPADGDFSLPRNSPALAVGFKPIDMRLIGIGNGSRASVQATEENIEQTHAGDVLQATSRRPCLRNDVTTARRTHTHPP